MKFREYLKRRFMQNHDNRCENYIRFMLDYNKSMKSNVLTEILSNDDHSLCVKMYATDIGHPILNNDKGDLCKKFLLSEMQYVRPICQLDCIIDDNGVVIDKIETHEKFRKRGLATRALHIAQDYYMNNKVVRRKIQEPLTHRVNLFAPLDRIPENESEELIDDDTLFLKLVKNIQTKASVNTKTPKQIEKNIYKKFLAYNHFVVENNSYKVPHRRMRERGILSEHLLDEKNRADYLQIGSEVFGFDLSQISSQDGR